METDNSITKTYRGNLEKTGQQIVPIDIERLFSDVSEAYDIVKK